MKSLKSKPTLANALRASETSSPRIAFVGAGGKTTALFETAKALAPCMVSTTTHLGAWQAAQADQHIVVSTSNDLHALEALPLTGTILVTGEEKGERLTAPEEGSLHVLNKFCKITTCLSSLKQTDHEKNRSNRRRHTNRSSPTSWIPSSLLPGYQDWEKP